MTPNAASKKFEGGMGLVMWGIWVSKKKEEIRLVDKILCMKQSFTDQLPAKEKGEKRWRKRQKNC